MLDIFPDMPLPPNTNPWEEYLQTLRELPFVKEARVRTPEPARWNQRWDGELDLETPQGAFRLRVEEKRIPRINRAAIDAYLKTIKPETPQDHILFTSHVTRAMAKELADKKINFVDLAGNCHVELGGRFLAHREGLLPQPKLPGQRTIGQPGYWALFTLLANPDLLNAPLRVVAQEAEVAKTTVADTLERLEHDGLLGKTANGRILLRPDELIDRWTYGYLDILRPRLILGQFRTRIGPQALERAIEDLARAATPQPRFGWGGGAAAFRLNHHYRGEVTVLHLQDRNVAWLNDLEMNPTKDGTFFILTARKSAFDSPVDMVVHPLLVYAELMAVPEGRAREAAVELRHNGLIGLR